MAYQTKQNILSAWKWSLTSLWKKCSQVNNQHVMWIHIFAGHILGLKGNSVSMYLIISFISILFVTCRIKEDFSLSPYPHLLWSTGYWSQLDRSLADIWLGLLGRISKDNPVPPTLQSGTSESPGGKSWLHSSQYHNADWSYTSLISTSIQITIISAVYFLWRTSFQELDS